MTAFYAVLLELLAKLGKVIGSKALHKIVEVLSGSDVTDAQMNAFVDRLDAVELAVDAAIDWTRSDGYAGGDSVEYLQKIMRESGWSVVAVDYVTWQVFAIFHGSKGKALWKGRWQGEKKKADALKKLAGFTMLTSGAAQEFNKGLLSGAGQTSGSGDVTALASIVSAPANVNGDGMSPLLLAGLGALAAYKLGGS